MAGKESTVGGRSRQQGTLPTSGDTRRVEKSTSEDRTLSLDQLDRTEVYSDNHYSWREVAEACHGSEGCSHE